MKRRSPKNVTNPGSAVPLKCLSRVSRDINKTETSSTPRRVYGLRRRTVSKRATEQRHPLHNVVFKITQVLTQQVGKLSIWGSRNIPNIVEDWRKRHQSTNSPSTTFRSSLKSFKQTSARSVRYCSPGARSLFTILYA